MPRCAAGDGRLRRDTSWMMLVGDIELEVSLRVYRQGLKEVDLFFVKNMFLSPYQHTTIYCFFTKERSGGKRATRSTGYYFFLDAVRSRNRWSHRGEQLCVVGGRYITRQIGS